MKEKHATVEETPSIDDLVRLFRTPQKEKQLREYIPTWPLHTLEARDGEKKLFIYGDSHHVDQQKAAALLEKFEQQKPDLVLVEGTYHWKKLLSQNEVDRIDPQEFLKEYGEQGYMTLMAKKAGTPVKTWDISRQDQLAEAQKKFNLQTIIAWGIGQAAKHVLSRGLQVTVPEVQKIFELGGFEFDWKQIDLEQICREVNGKELQDLSMEDGERIASPSGTGETNTVIRYLNQLRDRHAMQVLLQAKKKYHNIFITTGGSHVITWEPAIRALYPEV